MKKFTIFTAMFTIMIMSFCTTPLFAKDTGVYVGIGGSHAYEDFKVNSEVHDALNFLGMSDSFEDADGVSLKIGYHLDEVHSIELSVDCLPGFGYSDSISSTDGTATIGANAEIDIITFMAVVKIAPDFTLKNNNIKPFVAFGLGVMHGRLDVKASASLEGYGSISGSESDSYTGPCFKAGGGVDIFVTKNVSIGAEAYYVVGQVDLRVWGQDIIDECNYVNCTLGVAYHF